MANDGRWKFQSIVIVSSTLKIINVKGDVSDRNLGICPHRTPTREVYVVSVANKQPHAKPCQRLLPIGWGFG